VFEFTIPLQLEDLNYIEEKKEDVENFDFLKGKTILIAEDDALIRLLFKIVLNGKGLNLLFAGTGTQAVRIYEETANIDLVLLDIRMPEMNGIVALDKILNLNPDAKVVMQTAYVMHDEKEKCFKKGCVGFLSKPVVKVDLFNMLHKCLAINA